MISYSEAQDRLILHEGLRLQPYRCPAGYETIGVGRNVETNPLTDEEIKVCGDWEHGITRNAALFLLRNDIERTKEECRKNIWFWNELDDERQYALLDMAFNLGINGLLKFKNMLRYMSFSEWRSAAKECLNSKYATDVGKRAQRIAHLIETGIFKV